MKKVILLLVTVACAFGLNAQTQIIFDGETIHEGWWPTGSTQFVDVWNNPSPDEVNSTEKALTIWMNNGADIWTGGGIGGLNIDVNTYNSISIMVYKQVVGKVQLELQDGTQKVYLQKEYTTPGKWQKLVYDIPIGLGNITTLLVAPHLENTNETPLPEDESRRMWWDEVVAFHNPDAVSAVFTKETLQTSSGATLNYRKMTPANIESGKQYPLVIFLHGAGERGSDNGKQLALGGELFAKNRETHPAFVLFPQCPTENFWPFNTAPASTDASTFPVDYPTSTIMEQVKEMLDLYLAKDEVDKERIYIVGVSMGGMGTFDLVCRFPSIFTAAIPICGGINVDRITANVDSIYWRLFHGDADNDVPVENSRTAYAKLQSIHADAEYIEEAGVAHDVWNDAFAREDFLPWLFSKTKKLPSGISETENSDGIKISLDKNILSIETGDANTFSANVYAIDGVKVQSLNETSDSETFDMSALNSGIYLVNVIAGDKSQTAKIHIK